MERYDIVIVGAGCAGLSLMYQLLNSSFKNSSILLIEPDTSIPNKTWCYWAEAPLPIHPKEQAHSWDQISLELANQKISKDLGALKYFHLSSKDFYNSIFELISRHPNVSVLNDQAIEISQVANQAKIKTKNGRTLESALVFDSRLPQEAHKDPALKQIFLGWRIQVDQPTFNPGQITLMDILPSESSFEFFYILPFSSTEALVEFTTYSKSRPSETFLAEKIETYLKSKFDLKDYQVSYKENGVIPMSTRIASKNLSETIIPIGTAAGWIKASTGYGFWNIQKNCQQLVQAMEKRESPSNQKFTSGRFAFYDNILLTIAHRWPGRLQHIFMNLFQTSSAESVLRFLSEETKFGDELRLLSRLKFPIFIKSLLNYEKH
jgi:lycopene beta-cyclase